MNKSKSLKRYIAKHQKVARYKRYIHYYVSGSGEPIDRPFNIVNLFTSPSAYFEPFKDWTTLFMKSFGWAKNPLRNRQ